MKSAYIWTVTLNNGLYTVTEVSSANLSNAFDLHSLEDARGLIKTQAAQYNVSPSRFTASAIGLTKAIETWI